VVITHIGLLVVEQTIVTSRAVYVSVVYMT